MYKEIIEKYLPIIQKHYPKISHDEIKLFADGHDHYVLVVNGIKAFRFPRSSQHGEKDPIDNILLKEIAKDSPVNIPVFEPQEEGNINYQTFDFISGVGFSREIAKTFSTEEKETIGLLLGQFLRVVHAFPIDRARSLNMDEINSPEDYAEFFEDQLKKVQQQIFSLLSESEQNWIIHLFEDYIHLVKKKGFEVRVTHFDMLPEHIIVNPDTHTLSGVIDFSFRIADPARDFMFFDRYGKNFLQASYESYGKIDEDFDKRRKFYAGELPIANLLTSLENNDTELIRVHLLQLKEYIAAIPTN